jgi:hypothetical protein
MKVNGCKVLKIEIEKKLAVFCLVISCFFNFGLKLERIDILPQSIVAEAVLSHG